MPPAEPRHPALSAHLLRIVQRTETALLAALLSAMLLLAGAQIVLRNLFDTGIYWADPLLRILVLWIALLGALAATRDNNHIKIDLLSRYLPKRLQRAAVTTTTLFAALVCGLIAWHGARFVWQEYQAGVTLCAQLPAWPFQSIIPIGFALMTLRFLLCARLAAAAPRKGAA